MKKLKFLTVMLLTLTFAVSSCKKDKDDEGNNSVAIVGKWKVTKVVETEYDNNVKGDVDTDTSFGADEYVEFKSNGEVFDAFTKVTLNYKVDGSKIKYSAGGLNLFEATILSLTSTELVLEETDDEGNGDKYVTTTTYTKF